MPWDSRVDETSGLVRTPEIKDFWGRLQAREDVNRIADTTPESGLQQAALLLVLQQQN